MIRGCHALTEEWQTMADAGAGQRIRRSGVRPCSLHRSGGILLVSPGALLYHVTSRGNAHAAIFLDDKDRERFLTVSSPDAWI